MLMYCKPLVSKSGSEAVYALLEHAFLVKYGRNMPEIRKTPHGKPYFPEFPYVYFSLSHAKTHVLCAISDSPVGCDIESPRQISRSALRFFSSPEELDLFEPLDLWVLKESYIKLFGQTIASIRTLRFSLAGDRIIVPDTSVEAKLYRICDCSAAVCSMCSKPPDSIVLI